MKSILIKPFALLLALCLVQACNNRQTNNSTKTTSLFDTIKTDTAVNVAQYNNTKGYWPNGKLITEFDCPDAVSTFPPIDLLFWYRTPAVNGRFPTYAETHDGTAISHYGEKITANIKPYNLITLPKLAYRLNAITKANEYLVVVIQITQTAEDTVIGFRYLTGGCGGSKFQNFHFLSEEEVNKVITNN